MLWSTRLAANPRGWEPLLWPLVKDKGTIEEVYEPYLIQEGFLQRTPKRSHFPLPKPTVIWGLKCRETATSLFDETDDPKLALTHAIHQDIIRKKMRIFEAKN